MKAIIIAALLTVLGNGSVLSQKVSVRSPNEKIAVELYNSSEKDSAVWYFRASYTDSGQTQVAIPRIQLGLIRSDQSFSKGLQFVKAGKPVLIKEQYNAVHGKRSVNSNSANQVIISFKTPSDALLNIIVRAYDNGIAFRYEFPEKKGAFVVKEELTAYQVAPETIRWMEKWNPANEAVYRMMKAETVQPGEWCYPALFKTADKDCWFLLHEADLDETYCGSKLSNTAESSTYKITFPDQRDGRGLGASQPSITLPWKSPWRVITLGSLADIVESNLVDDVSAPSVVKETGWIKPGVASWNYWSNNHGTKDYKVVCEFADLAAKMNWPYTLLDWEWDAMSNGGKLEDALAYIHSKGVKPLIWYNSGGPHTGVTATPRDRMLTHENRVEEFTKLKKLGLAGVKIDFFESEKQDMIRYYLDILKDAAEFRMMVYFHGCLVPRGWARTYPHLMTYEGVRGAEWYNNVPVFTTEAPAHNTILPFTRNVVGAMDYTPVTFTNSQYPHITSYGHELALSVVFESGLQHFADRPDGYNNLPDAAKTFLRDVPNAWDDLKFVDGYPGSDVIIARRKGSNWYVGGINGQAVEKTKTLRFDFLDKGVKYKLTLLADGKHDRDFGISYTVVQSTDSVKVRLLRQGGFAAYLIPVQ